MDNRRPGADDLVDLGKDLGRASGSGTADVGQSGAPSRQQGLKLGVGKVAEHEAGQGEAFRKALQRSKDFDGFHHVGSGLLGARLGSGSIERAVAIFRAVGAAVAARGWKAHGKPGEAGLVINGEYVAIRLFEASTANRRHASPSGYLPRYSPTGVLKLLITNANYLGVRTDWSDTRRQKVEEQIESFVEGMAGAAVALAKRRLEREEEERRYHELLRQREAERRLLKIDRVRGAVFKEQADNHRLAADLRGYLEEVKSRLVSASAVDPETVAWVTWADRYVAQLDPLANGPPALLGEDEALRLAWQYRDK